MIANGARILADDENSLVEVRRRSAKMLDSRRIGVPLGLFWHVYGCIDGKKC